MLGSEARLSKAEARQPASAHFFRRRDFEGRERELMEEASSSDASRSQKQRGARSSKSTHTHTRALPHHTAEHHHVLLFHLVLLSASTCTASTYPFFFTLSPLPSPCQSHAPAAHRHPCAVRAISAASGHSNKHKQRNEHGRSLRCVSARAHPPTFPSPPLRLSLLSVRVRE